MKLKDFANILTLIVENTESHQCCLTKFDCQNNHSLAKRLFRRPLKNQWSVHCIISPVKAFLLLIQGEMTFAD